MNVTIRRLMNTFIILFLLISGVAAYVQVNNQAFLNGPVLAAGNLDPRACLAPDDQPLRGTIYDRNGVWLARTVRDDKAPCGFRREYSDPTLAPLIGYFSYTYGASGIEAQFNDYLAGIGVGASPNEAINKILHRPRHGNDLYLTIDEKLQKKVAALYESHSAVLYTPSGGVCEVAGTNPPGSIIVEDPNTGQIRAMYSYPYYDPNKIDDPTYWKQINSDPGHPLLNHATQGLYDPGSTFKTVTLLAALDSGQYSLNTPFDFNSATALTVNGEHIKWEDYFNGTWNGVLNQNSFPITMQQGYAYSDNEIFARASVQIGAQTWLKYVRAFGIQTPNYESSVTPVPFDGVSAQSSAYNALDSNGKPNDFPSNPNLLAESGFGQGQLLITPLTMTEIASTIASGGYLYEPHVVSQIVPYGENRDSVLPGGDGLIGDKVAYGGGPIIESQTAAAARAAMWSVVSYGTANFSPNPVSGISLKQSGTHEGGKTGTGQSGNVQPETWWLSLAPDDQAPGGGAAKYVVSVHKEHSGEGACQVWVADNIYQDLGA
jgi:cell division protein FtsI/penicillin-binding protein 2